MMLLSSGTFTEGALSPKTKHKKTKKTKKNKKKKVMSLKTDSKEGDKVKVF